MQSEWTSYIAGAVLTLVYKWARFVYQGCKAGKPVGQATAEWFFEPSAENAVSWTATIGGVWLLGSIYIDHAIEITGLTDLPVLDSLAFLLGSLMEFTAPAVCKWIVSRLPK